MNTNKQFRFRLTIGLLLLVCNAPLPAFSQTVAGGCGPLRTDGQYGPYDMRHDPSKLPIVLGAHFTPAIEALIEGTNSSTVAGDIDYTLRAIPNYHRALMAMMRLGEREKAEKPRNTRYSVECWFLRAIAFAPDDPIVRMLYSTFLNSKKRVSDASQQLDMAITFAKDNPFTHYNIGLHYFDLKSYDKALAQAHKAMALGFMQSELKDELVRVGKWIDPSEATATSTPVAK